MATVAETCSVLPSAPRILVTEIVRAAPSFDDVFHEQAPFVWRSLRYLGVAESDVPDVCQEVFVVVHRRLSEFEGRSTVRTWIYGICLRAAHAWRRRGTRREMPVAELPDQEAPERPDRALDAEQARRILLDALDRLDPVQREIYVLHEIEELPMREIAEIVGCPMQTAYSRLHVARERVASSVRRPRRAP